MMKKKKGLNDYLYHRYYLHHRLVNNSMIQIIPRRSLILVSDNNRQHMIKNKYIIALIHKYQYHFGKQHQLKFDF